jgi:(R)-2-hydroxyacyl-CoA dehydratese activating ATPase
MGRKSENGYAHGLFVGVDVGASRTKVAVMDPQKRLLGFAVEKSGTNFAKTADFCLKAAFDMAGAKRKQMVYAVSTGYGRQNVAYADENRTEIGCHARGCYHYFPMAISIIDIGGQDNKIIKLNEAGKQTGFKMNRKCAAGTGAFLEEMAPRLDIDLGAMNKLAAEAETMIKLGSYCTVFSATEVLEHIRNGHKVPDIVKGLFFSVVRRVLEMDTLTDEVVMTGGVVAHNGYLVEMAQEQIGRKILVPEHPQLTGAIGAALYGIKQKQAF